MLQLSLFEIDEKQSLKDEIEKLKLTNDKLRKSLYAKHGQLAKNYNELSLRMEIVERFICKGDSMQNFTQKN